MSLLDKIKSMIGIGKVSPKVQSETSVKDRRKTVSNNTGRYPDCPCKEDNTLTRFIVFDNEMRRDIPENNRLHITGNASITLTNILQLVGMDVANIKVEHFYLVITDYEGKKFYTKDDFDTYNIIDDIVSNDGKLSIKGKARNIFVYIPYIYKEKECFIELDLKPEAIGHGDVIVLNRVSVGSTMPESNALKCDKVMFTYSASDNNNMAAKAEQLRKCCLDKIASKQHPEDNEALAAGLTDNYLSYHEDAQKLMGEGYWGDAISCLRKAYLQSKDKISADNDSDAAEILGFTCHDLGECYYEKHLYLKALFYFERGKAIDNDNDIDAVYHDCLVHLNDPRLMMPEENSISRDCYVLENVFETIFDIIPGELGDMLWIDNRNNTHGMVSRQKDIMQYDIVKAMENTDSMTLHMSYRYRSTIVDDEYSGSDVCSAFSGNNALHDTNSPMACIDKSTAMTDNVLIVNLTKRDGMIEMGVMVPSFSMTDNNNKGYPLSVNLKYNTKPYITREQFNALREKVAMKKKEGSELSYNEIHVQGNLQEAAYLFINASEAFDHGVWGDALYYATKVSNMILMKRASDEINISDKRLLLECFYIQGFVYSELKQWELSIYYLSLLYHTHNINWTMDYINSLTNSKDLFAHGIVLEELQRVYNFNTSGLSQEDYNRYIPFLLRCFANILMEERNYDGAEGLYKELLKYPGCKDIALCGLKFINEHR